MLTKYLNHNVCTNNNVIPRPIICTISDSALNFTTLNRNFIFDTILEYAMYYKNIILYNDLTMHLNEITKFRKFLYFLVPGWYIF